MLRWEFIFALNLLLSLSFPLFALKKKLNSIFVFIITTFSLFLTYLICSLRWSLNPIGDFSYFTKLYFLHLGPSLILLTILYLSTEGRRLRLLKIYLCLAASLLVAVLLFLATPSMAAFDPFWGVIPGTVSLDPIIDLDVYWFRLITLVISLVIILGLGVRYSVGPFSILGISWAVILICSQFTASPFTLSFFAKRHFASKEIAEDFEIYLSEKDAPALAWLNQLRFLKREITKRFPKDYTLDDSKPLKVFIYVSDQEKKRWIGAERTQIGNFLRGEMHLSEIEIDSPTLEHELAHLLHGRLKAPLLSYIDPFQFEGLAVALTDPDPGQLLRTGSAIFRILSTQGLQPFWPHLWRFYSELPPYASYQLAGASAVMNLTKDRWPWAQPEILPDILKQVEVHDDDLVYASRILKARTLLDDPLRRDCARLLRDGGERFDISYFRSFLYVCELSPLAYEAVFKLTKDRELALAKLASLNSPLQEMIQGDLLVMEEKFHEANARYKKCELNDCLLKSKILRTQPNELKRILLQSNQPAIDYRMALLPDPKVVSELSLVLKLHERLKMYELIQRKRVLTPNESLDRQSVLFYREVLTKASVPKMKSILNELQRYRGPEADRMRRRILFAIQN